MLDIVLGSEMMGYLGNDFESIIVSAGDLLYDIDFILEMMSVYEEDGCNVTTSGCELPFLLNKRALKIYTRQRKGSKFSNFVNMAEFEGERFSTVKPKMYFDIDTPRDYKRLAKLLM